MKYLIYPTIFVIYLLGLGFRAQAQVPEMMTYQSIITDASNDPISNTAVGVKISVLQGGNAGSAVYVETHNPTTSPLGLITLRIGKGTILSGTFSSIDWSAANYWIKTEIDPAGGTNYTITGASQLLSVPYALYAKTAGNGGSGDDLGNHIATQNLQLGSNWLSGDGGDEGVYIDATGNVGVGINTPAEKLHVAGAIRMVDGNQQAGYVPVSDANGTMAWTNSNTLRAGGLEDADGDTRVEVEQTADDDLIRFTTAGTEFFRMNNGRLLTLNAQRAVVIGEGAGEQMLNSTNTTRLIAIGYQAGQNTVGASGLQAVDNIAIGAGALRANTTGYNNVALGWNSLNDAVTLRNNTGLGNGTLPELTSGNNNTVAGSLSGYKLTTGEFNTFTGAYSAYNLTTGSNNTFSGAVSGQDLTTGSNNTFFGAFSGINLTSGSNNTFIGHYSANNLLNADRNTFLGVHSGSNSDGSDNVFLGYNAGRNSTGSSLLYIENSNSSSPLIYGEFDNNIVGINGSLGVGTTSPAARLHVTPASGVGIQVDRTNGNPSIEAGTSGSNWLIADGNVANSGRVSLNHYSSGNVIVANGGGNVGIGNTAPAEKLHVSGSIRMVDGNQQAGYVMTSDANGTGRWAPHVGDDFGNHTATENIQLGSNWLTGDGANCEGMYIDADGNTGVGIMPQSKFHVSMGEVASSTQMVSQTSGGSYAGQSPTWQSFTATESGILERITFRFYQKNASNTRIVDIYEGQGTAGKLLSSNNTAFVNTGTSTVSFPISGNVCLQAGKTYSILIDNGGRILYTASNPYSGGRASLNSSVDLWFQVYAFASKTGFQVSNNGVTINEYTLPSTDGSSGQALTTDGGGNVSWGTAASDTTSATIQLHRISA